MACPKAKTKETKTRYLLGGKVGEVGIVWNHEFLFSLFSFIYFYLFLSFWNEWRFAFSRFLPCLPSWFFDFLLREIHTYIKRIG